MKDASTLVREKFSELLIGRRDHRDQFTHAERAIWLVIQTRIDISMDGFMSLFEQSFERSLIVEAADYIREIDLPEYAAVLEEAISLLDANNFYTVDGWPAISSQKLPQDVRERLAALARTIQIDDKLWSVEVDEALSEMLNREANA